MKSNKTPSAIWMVTLLVFGFSYAFGTQEVVEVFVNEPEFEFDPVPEGAEVTHAFIIQNPKEQMLLIKEVISS